MGATPPRSREYRALTWPDKPPTATARYQRQWSLALWTILTTTLTLAICACGSDTPGRQVSLNPRPVAFRPWDFPDVPMPPGYSAADDTEQLAVVIAGGASRRMAMVLQQVRRDRGLRDRALLEWYDQRLPAFGWYPLESSESRVRLWGKRRTDQREERLRLATGRSANSAIIRIQLSLSPDDPAQAD